MKEMLSEELLLQIKSYNDKGLYMEQYDPSPVIDRMYHDIRSLQQQANRLQSEVERKTERNQELYQDGLDKWQREQAEIYQRDTRITELEQQVNTLTEALEEAKSAISDSSVLKFINTALQSIKESPREEQTP